MFGKKILVMALAAALALTGCGAVSNVVGNAIGGKSNTAANLWPDVPALDGAAKTNVDIPLPLKLAAQAMVKASAASNDAKLDSFDVIAFSTKKTPQDVGAFYTAAKMQGLGWNLADQPGCMVGSDSSSAGGGFCMFGKKNADGKTGSVLLLALAQDDKTKDTQVFYMRFDGVGSTK